MNIPDKVPEAEDQFRISIIIATFNAGAYLADCLQSIRLYAPDRTEVVVMDGGSTDNTIDILKKEESLSLKWASEPDHGIYDALNKAIKKASGRWLYFLGADDRLLPPFAELAQELEEDNTVYYASSMDNFGDRKNVFPLLKGYFSKYRIAKFCMNHQSIIYPSAVFVKYQYELKYKVAADYVLNMKVWGDEQFNKKFFPLFIVSYDMNGFSSRTKDQALIRDKSQLVKKHLGWWVYLRYRYKKFKENRRGNYEI